jgi:hypothetical protein
MRRRAQRQAAHYGADSRGRAGIRGLPFGVSSFLLSLVRFFEVLTEAPQISLTPKKWFKDLSHTPV